MAKIRALPEAKVLAKWIFIKSEAFWQQTLSGCRLIPGPCPADVWLLIQNPQHAKRIALSRECNNAIA